MIRSRPNREGEEVMLTREIDNGDAELRHSVAVGVCIPNDTGRDLNTMY